MLEKPSYEELKRRVQELEKAAFEHQRTENLLKESDKKYRHFSENAIQGDIEKEILSKEDIIRFSSSAIATCDLEGNMTYANPCFKKLWGLGASENFVEKSFSDFCLRGDHYEKIMASVKLEGSWAGELQAKRQCGSLFDVQISAAMIFDKNNDPMSITFTATDITEQRRLEKALRERDELFRTVADNFPQGILVIHDADLYYTFAAGLGLKEIGIPAEMLIGKKPQEIFPPEFCSKLEDHIRRAFNGKQETFEISLGDHVFSETVCPIYKNEQITSVLGVITNITERRQAEEKLSSAHEKLLTVLDSIDATIYVADMDTHEILFMNKKMIETFGRDMTGEVCFKAFREETEPCSFCTNHLLLDENEKSTGLSVWEGKNPITGRIYINHDRAIEWISGHKARLQIAVDITEQTKMEMQLRQAQKMEAIGTLAGGIAHDFNNMLNVILGHAEFGLNKIDPLDPLHEDLQQILNAALRSADITRQLLAFARKQTISPKVLDLNLNIEAMLKIIRRLIGENIDVIWKPLENLWTVKMDPAQIDQLLTNLCVNSRDAISGVGKITIETGMATFDQIYCSHHTGFVPGDFVLLAVTDDGCGMEKETLNKLFDPFFSTKDIGKGTGLGLSTAYGIVKQNHGFINVYSELGQGTAFKIYLPRYFSNGELLKISSPDEPMPGGHETILLVEDDMMMLELAVKMLEIQGYNVLSAGRPGEAIRMAGEYIGEIHLLITDVVMPEMNGRNLSKQLVSLYPNLKLLFMSGYTSNAIAHQGVLDEDIHFIQKPFSVKDFAIKVREALNGNKDA